VATYESFAAVLQRSAFRPGTVVADEIHLIADDDRGPGVEGLFARLLSKGRMGALCALSAVVQNGTELAGWLGIPLLEGTTADRPVPLTLEHAVVDDADGALQRILEPCTNGERALVFCSSRGGAERTARSLKDVIAPCIPQRDEAALRAELRRSVQQCDFPRFCRHASGQAAAA
jgi:helicase